MSKPVRPQKPNTIEAVALAAGVSTMTVSRVMRRTGNVSRKTTDRVMAAVQELGYVHNRLAGALASSRSDQVAVIIPSLLNIVFPEVLAGITDAFDGTRFQPVVGITDYNLEKERELVHAMITWRPAGIIIANSYHHAEVDRLLRQVDSPVVEIMELAAKPIDMCVGPNQRKAGAHMAKHLLGKGYRRFAYLGADHDLDKAAARRLQGFESVLRAKGGRLVATMTAPTPSGISLGRENMATVLAKAPDVEVVYFSNDAVAAGALMYCMGEGIDVPGDLALASFSGLEIASAMPTTITTIRSPRYEIGKTSVGLILDRLAGRKTPQKRDLGFELIEGESS